MTEPLQPLKAGDEVYIRGLKMHGPHNGKSELMNARVTNCKDWSGRGDLNSRPPAPKAGALPGCATPRQEPQH